MGAMHFLNETGHATLEWDAADDASLIVAGAEFETLTETGYVPFKRDDKQQQAQRIDTFDPTADEILWLRPLQGG
ncbi:MAG: hypothetical protein ACRDKT_13320 [Actinomycetota bacterium]